MLSPEPMRHLTVVVLSGELENVTRAIARVGVLHLLDVRRSVEMPAGIRPFEVNGRRAELERMEQSLERIARYLDVRLDVTDVAQDRMEDGLDRAALEQRLAELALRVDDLRSQQLRCEHDEAQLENLLRNLRALAPLGLPLEHLRDLRYASFFSGLLPARNLPRLRESLTRTVSVVVPAGETQPDGRILIAALCVRPDQETLERALRSAQLERFDLPSTLSGPPDEAIATTQEQLRAAEQRRESLVQERTSLAQQSSAELRTLAALIGRERLLLEARTLMGVSERTAMIAGWVPAVLAATLEQAVRDASGGRCLVQWREPATMEEVRQGRIPVPILLRNPVLIRPFEGLLRAYGLPRYGEVEPTALMALAFLTMFGFMFGDVGQGSVLFATGYFIYRRMFRYRDYALILMECGVFAAAFGFLYGSFFGSEHLLPALWMRPMENIPTLMKTAIGFGVAFLSLGLGLNLVNALRRHDAAALWGHNGLLAALAYWVAAGLFLRRVTAGPDAVTFGTFALVVSLPMLLILLKGPTRLVARGLREGEWPRPGDALALLIESAVELLDTIVAAISNTATFVRLAAFALSHAGLLLATFSVADAVAHAGGGTIGAVFVMVVGNLVVIALEGVIVAIQGIRLEYYEFFSKFYGGGGEEYRPLRLAATQAARP
jgi:V/A-type H+-transporting ATPase subunit I